MHMSRFKCLLMSFSLASLWILPKYLIKQWYTVPEPTSLDNLSGMIIVGMIVSFALGFFFFCGSELSHCLPNRMLKIIKGIIITLTVAIILNDIRLDMNLPFEYTSLWFGCLLFIIGLLICLLIRNFNGTLRVSQKVLVAISPFIIFLYIQLGYTFFHLVFYPYDTPALYFSTKDKPRVLWIIFDELDIRLAFEHRLDGLILEELDRFKNASVFATNAHAGGTNTIISVPAMILGKKLDAVKIAGEKHLQLVMSQNKQPVFWHEQPNLFSKARELECNSVVKGFHHPYHKIFGMHLCNQPPSQNLREFFQKFFWKLPWKILSFLRPIFDLKNFSPISLQPGRYAEEFVDESLSLILDSRNHLTFIHYPFPHPPGIYSCEIDGFCFEERASSFGNLLLTDKIVGRLRKEMEKKGLWDSTTVIITSDHWLRKVWTESQLNLPKEHFQTISTFDSRVPFLIKFPYQKHSVIYDEPFSTVLIHDLILEMLRENITNSQGFIEWMEQNRTRIPYEVAEAFKGKPF